MTISQVAAVLGLDETDGVRLVPLTDEDIDRAHRQQQAKQQRHPGGEKRRTRPVRHGRTGG